MSIHRSNKPHGRLDALSLAFRMWESTDTPVSLSCWIIAKSGDFRQLVEKEISASHYSDPLCFALDYQAVKLLSKFPYLNTGIDTKVVAYRKFVEAEDACLRTNTRFKNQGCDHLSGRVGSVFYRATQKIALILGDVPRLQDLDFSFGPGAAFGTRGDTSVYKKVSSTLECTHAFADTLQEFLEEFPGWIPAGVHRDVNLVPGSQLIVVPKNAKTDRPICIEPLLNGLYQKGVGSWIRNRLKKFGVDLKDQSVNQRLAAVAYKDHLATVDFSSASDMISYMLVMDILPINWFAFLDVARCPSYLVEGTWYNFQKFTSMGNAYTFELESLIFYAIACATCEELGIEYETGKNLSVYGDDVIIPRAAFDLFSEVTEECGFVINREKSFSEGQFYESCGHDFFMGYFVRPLLLTKKLNTLPAAFYAANQIKRITNRFPKGYRRDFHSSRVDSFPSLVSRFRGVHTWVIGCIPPQHRVVGPEGYGDGHLIDNAPQGQESRHPCWDGWWFHTYVERPARVIFQKSLKKQRKLKLKKKKGRRKLPNPVIHEVPDLEVPMAYALYFTRGQRSLLSDSDPLLLRDYVTVPDPVDNGSGYDVRGRTSIKRVKVYCHLSWQDTSWRYEQVNNRTC